MIEDRDELAFYFKDYTSILDKSVQDNMELIRQLYSDLADDNDDSVLVNSFCNDVNAELAKTKYGDVILANESDDECDKGIVNIFQLYGNEWYTTGMCGALQFENIRGRKVSITIGSRFDDDNSYFLMYILRTAFDAGGKMLDMEVHGSKDHVWDYLLMLVWVKQAHNALKKGMYKLYQENEHNDFRVRGRLDIARHIRENGVMTCGRAAYSTRDYSVDNAVNRLILVTEDILERKYREVFTRIVSRDNILKDGISVLRNELAWGQDMSVDRLLKKADKKIVKNVYRNYEQLRKTSIAIIKRWGINSFVKDKNVVSGILISMPGLWEVFLHRQIFAGLTDGSRQYSQQEYDILQGKRKLRPDFFIENNNGAYVFDAKYKRGWGESYEGGPWENRREDVFQVLSYMYCLKCNIGGVIFPYKGIEDGEYKSFTIGQKLAASHESMWLVPVKIPEQCENARDFEYRMKSITENIALQIKKVMK